LISFLIGGLCGSIPRGKYLGKSSDRINNHHSDRIHYKKPAEKLSYEKHGRIPFRKNVVRFFSSKTPTTQMPTTTQPTTKIPTTTEPTTEIPTTTEPTTEIPTTQTPTTTEPTTEIPTTTEPTTEIPTTQTPTTTEPTTEIPTTQTPTCSQSMFYNLASLGPWYASNDVEGNEYGTKFSSSVPGVITAIVFYDPAGNGNYLGYIWDTQSHATPLVTATFTSISVPGTVYAHLSTPLHIDAGHQYVTSVNFQDDGSYFGIIFSQPTSQSSDLTLVTSGLDCFTASCYPSQSVPDTYVGNDIVFVPDSC